MQLQPFTVLDLESTEERGGTSLANAAEAQLALHLFNELRRGTDGLSTSARVAVVSVILLTPFSNKMIIAITSLNPFTLLSSDHTLC